MIVIKEISKKTQNLLIFNQIIKENSKFFSKILRKYIKEIRLDFFDFWLKYGDEILNFIEKFFKFEEEDTIELIKLFVCSEIDDLFFNYTKYSEEFLDLLDYNSYYRQYFNWFKKYYLYFFKEIDIPIENIDVFCLLEEDIEVSDENYIKIVITLPLDMKYYKIMLKIMGIFIKKQEYLIKNVIQYNNHQKEIFESFKKTYFIFNTIDE